MTHHPSKRLKNKAAGPSASPPIGLAELIEKDPVYRARTQAAMVQYQRRFRALQAAAAAYREAGNDADADADGAMNAETQVNATQAGDTDIAQEGVAHATESTVVGKDIGGQEKSTNNIRVPQALDAAQE